MPKAADKNVMVTVVKQLPHHPKVKGSTPAYVAGTGIDRMAKSNLLTRIRIYSGKIFIVPDCKF